MKKDLREIVQEKPFEDFAEWCNTLGYGVKCRASGGRGRQSHNESEYQAGGYRVLQHRGAPIVI